MEFFNAKTFLSLLLMAVLAFNKFEDVNAKAYYGYKGYQGYQAYPAYPGGKDGQYYNPGY